jgi:adenylate cyclase
MTKDDTAQAKQRLDEAISIDPHFANAYTELAGCHILDFMFSWSKSPIESLSISEQIAQKALELDDTSSARYHTFGLINLCKLQYSEAIDNFEKAVLMNPNGAHDHLFLGFALTLSDSIDKGIVHLEKAMRINPIPPTHYWTIIGVAYSLAGKYEKSITCYKKAIQTNPDDLQANLGLTSAYSRAGLEEDARKTAQNVLRIDPGFSLENYSRSSTLLMIKNKSYRQGSLEALRKAGIPE